MANPMENNKAVKMLKAAEEGGYGVVGVVSVRVLNLDRDITLKTVLTPIV
jgi:hypothetical protein